MQPVAEMSSIPSGTNFPRFCHSRSRAALIDAASCGTSFCSSRKRRVEGKHNLHKHVTAASQPATKDASLSSAVQGSSPSTRAARPAGATARRETSPSRPRELASLSRASRRTSNSWSRVSHGPVARYVSLLRGCDSGRRILLPVPVVAVTERHFPRTFP